MANLQKGFALSHFSSRHRSSLALHHDLAIMAMQHLFSRSDILLEDIVHMTDFLRHATLILGVSCSTCSFRLMGHTECNTPTPFAWRTLLGGHDAALVSLHLGRRVEVSAPTR